MLPVAAAHRDPQLHFHPCKLSEKKNIYENINLYENIDDFINNLFNNGCYYIYIFIYLLTLIILYLYIID